jgi:nitrite reductase/ring-hydroxylating ferredoxin subunit
LFASAREIGKNPVSKKILGKELVAFRTSVGEVVVMTGQCSHLGASLAGGCVENDTIRCPYHGWRYGADGQCLEIPGQKAVPVFARQISFPVKERNGFIFFFNGPKASFDLPFFIGENANEYSAGGHFDFNAGCRWYMLAAHAFDQRHIEYVHERQLLSSLEIDQPAPHARRAVHTSLVVGESKFDRIIRLALGKKVTISMTVWGGNMVLVEGNFKKARSRFFLMATPQEDGTSQVDGIIFIRKTGIRIFDSVWGPLNFAIRRWFTSGYLLNELNDLRTHIYRAGALGEQDQKLIEYFHWVSKVAAPRLAPVENQPVAGPLEARG